MLKPTGTPNVLRSLSTCNNQLSGEAPEWLSGLTALTQRSVLLGECASGGSSACTPGYWCTNSSLSIVANPCLAGSYSTAGASSCTQCALGKYSTAAAATSDVCMGCVPGRYGASTGASSSDCTGPCDAGRWGAVGQTTSQCSGPCDAGYVASGSLSVPTESMCARRSQSWS